MPLIVFIALLHARNKGRGQEKGVNVSRRRVINITDDVISLAGRYLVENRIVARRTDVEVGSRVDDAVVTRVAGASGLVEWIFYE